MKSPGQKLVIVLLLIVLPILMALFLLCSRRETSFVSEPRELRQTHKSRADSLALEARERRVAETVWAKEILAEECGRTLEAFWDSLNRSTNKLELAAEFPFQEIVLSPWASVRAMAHGIEERPGGGGTITFSAANWRGFVDEFRLGGWQLEQTEFRQISFKTDDVGQARQSRFAFSAHLICPARPERAILEGELIVDWAGRKSRDGLQAVARVDASGLTVKRRTGEPPFRPVLVASITPPAGSSSIDPLLVYDLDGDGFSEIILPGKNLVYRRRAADGYLAEPLCRFPPSAVLTALIADIDGDGTADLLVANAGGLSLWKGSRQGRFEEPGQAVWTANPRLINPMVLTCGDIDHDGDLDVFLGQYRVPTMGQFLRPHFYDANDSHPAYLLLNDGYGRFQDSTAEAGLAAKRGRRVFSASFADLNDDGHLDLVVASDFAGLDLYRNDGHGRFKDVTADWVAESHAFGMALALADFNADGRLDLLMIGMTSPTVDRLEHLGLRRRGTNEDPTMRKRMTQGNRLYLARASGGLEQTSFGASLARSGWSWGCSGFDFDNDGFPDVYIANGYESQRSVRDYEPEFWLHDLYIDEAVDDVSATKYFTGKYARTRGAGWSYAGYEKNRFFLNQRGQTFFEAAYLFGVALENDSRNVVATDLDADGRVDLMVTTNEVWPEAKQTIRVYQNRIEKPGHWIGFRFREEGLGKSPIGARVLLRSQNGTAVRQIVTGDSLRSQHPAVLHFGLGDQAQVDSAEVRWVDGRTLILPHPGIDRYHAVAAPSRTQGQ